MEDVRSWSYGPYCALPVKLVRPLSASHSPATLAFSAALPADGRFWHFEGLVTFEGPVIPERRAAERPVLCVINFMDSTRVGPSSTGSGPCTMQHRSGSGIGPLESRMPRARISLPVDPRSLLRSTCFGIGLDPIC